MMVGGGGLGFGKTDSQESEDERRKKMRADVLSEVQRQCRPEFLNRVDEMIVFNPLTEDDLKKIVHIQLSEVLQRANDRGLKLELDDKAIKFLISQGFNEDYGARPLRRAIERFIEDPMAEEVLRMGENINKKYTISVKGEVADAEALSFEGFDIEPEPEKEAAVEAASSDE